MKIRAVAAVVASVLVGQAHGAGFQLAEYSATGLGRAFAGEAAIADNASSQGRNPALMTQLKGQQLSLGVIYIDPNIDAEGTTSASLAGNPVYSSKSSNNEIAPDAWVPNFYYSHQLNDAWYLGVAVNSAHGLSTELGEASDVSIFGSNAEITTIELAPSVAYKFNDQWSLGAALRFVHADGKVVANIPGWVASLPLDGIPPAGTQVKSVDGDGFDYGFRVGATWEPAKGHRIGLSYHSEVEVKLEGTASGLMYGNQGGSLKLPLPATAELASFHQLTERLSVHASVNWTDWSAFEALVVDFDSGAPSDVMKEENFKDNWRFAVGTTYQLNNRWVVRGGLAFDQTAVDDEHRTTTIPDSDRLWISFGAGYQWNDDLTLDFAITHITMPSDAPINETMELHLPAGGTVVPATINYNGEIDGDVWLAGAQLSYRF